jgi:putative endonuclease
MMKEYCVYIMASTRNGTLYTGVTADLIKRVGQHKSGETKGFTSKYKVNPLVYYELRGDIIEAIKREKNIVRHESATLLAAASAAEKVLTQHTSYLALGKLQ